MIDDPVEAADHVGVGRIAVVGERLDHHQIGVGGEAVVERILGLTRVGAVGDDARYVGAVTMIIPRRALLIEDGVVEPQQVKFLEYASET